MFDLLNWNYLIKSLHLYYSPPPLSTSSLIVFKEYTFNFAWAICFQWQITELILSFIPTINGAYSDWIFSERIYSIWRFKYFIRSRWDCLIFVNIRANVNQFLKIGEWRLLTDLFIKSMFSISILSSNLRISLDLNNGLEWESLDWKFIIIRAFFCRITILLTALRFWPHIRLA